MCWSASSGRDAFLVALSCHGTKLCVSFCFINLVIRYRNWHSLKRVALMTKTVESWIFQGCRDDNSFYSFFLPRSLDLSIFDLYDPLECN